MINEELELIVDGQPSTVQTAYLGQFEVLIRNLSESVREYTDLADKIVVNSLADTAAMAEAAALKKVIYNMRRDAINKIVTPAKDKIRLESLMFALENKAWIQIEAWLDSDCKGLEKELDKKANFAKFESERLLKERTDSRLKACFAFDQTVSRHELENLSDSSFEMVFNGLKAKKDVADLLVQQTSVFNGRKQLLLPYYSLYLEVYKVGALTLETSQEAFENILQTLLTTTTERKAAADALVIENQKLKDAADLAKRTADAALLQSQQEAAAKQRELEDAAKKERDVAAAKQREQEEALALERKNAAESLAREKAAAAEIQRKQAEALALEKAAAAKKELDQAAADRLAALRPDKEKLISFLISIQMPDVISDDAIYYLTAFKSFTDGLIEKINKNL